MPSHTNIGRPTVFSREIATRIIEELWEGKSLTKICKPDDMPAVRTVYYWLDDPENVEFLQTYSRARVRQAETIADETMDISDDGLSDTYIDADGNERVNHEVVNRSRLRVETRKWMASVLAPKKYGSLVTDGVETSLETLARKIAEQQLSMNNATVNGNAPLDSNTGS